MQQKVVLSESFENCLQMFKMCLQGGAIDENIVEEGCNKPTDERLKQLIHGCLNCCRCVGKTEGNHFVFVMSLVSAECGLMDVGGCHGDLMEALTKVQFGETRSIG